jgi:hypothetical protein
MNPTFGTLRQFTQKNSSLEECDLCSKRLPAEHPHLIEPFKRQLLCSCEACALLFTERTDAKYKRIPRDARYLNDFRMTDAQWEGLQLPIRMVFFFYSTPEQRTVALYPSPAGATESLLGLDSWKEIVESNPVLEKMKPDVEALLVNRIQSEHEYYLAPMDECFKLVGLIRANWRGFSGGAEAWQKIYSFFRELKSKSIQEIQHA